MVYRARHVTQWDGSPLDQANCRMAVAATHLDYHTQGEKTSTGEEMRALQDDQSGGTDSQDAQKAWARGFGETLVIRDGSTWARLVQDRGLGRFIELDVLYSVLTNRCQDASNFGHTIGIAPESRSGKWLVSDPLCAGYKYMDPDTLRAAAEAWGRRVYMEGFSGRTRGCERSSSVHRAPEGSTEQDVSGGSGPRYHSGRTGGSTGLRIRYSTSVTETEMLTYTLDPTKAHHGDVEVTIDGALAIRLDDGQPIGVGKGEIKEHAGYGKLAKPIGTGTGEQADRQSGWLLFGQRPAWLLGYAAREVPAQPQEPCEDEIAARDAVWVKHLTPPTP